MRPCFSEHFQEVNSCEVNNCSSNIQQYSEALLLPNVMIFALEIYYVVCPS